ncbi:hypothetical protein [Cypionkella sp. TWP1-2-1b2]|uniref:hypothetical protein n=1 Tax=Cypionkella sp. TWP1-2-1b2 TaxID=2804675 RepID=UPI003CF9E3F6
MGQISSLAAPSAPQFQSLIVKPVARAAAALMTPSLDSHATALKLRAELPTEAAPRPILPPASSEAIFKGLLPVPPAMIQAQEQADSDQIETLTEVDGISLDGIPYLRDGAVLLDDLPQAEPAPAPKAKSTEALTLAFVTPAALHPETEAQADADPELSDHAERAYLDEREISAVRAEPGPPTAPPDPDQANPDPPESDAATSVDKRA